MMEVIRMITLIGSSVALGISIRSWLICNRGWKKSIEARGERLRENIELKKKVHDLLIEKIELNRKLMKYEEKEKEN